MSTTKPRHDGEIPTALCAQLLENLSTATLVLDENLRVQYANPAAEQLLATSLPHLRPQTLASFFDDETSLASLRHTLASQRPHTQREARLRSPGSRLGAMVDYTATPLPPTTGSRMRLLVEILPLDRLIHLNREDSLFTARQATRALIRGMAHEIKNPLGGIRGAAQLLARELDSATLQEYTTIIINEADRLRNLADRMLGSRKRPDFRRINIHLVLERVRVILQAETGPAITVLRDYDPSLPEVWADTDQLIQVVLNLARNAAQALLEMKPQDTSRSRPARIILRSRVLRQFTIGTQRHPLLCLIEVEDNGPGISRDLRETLFYPMVTNRSQGTGLGLPIAQSIMQQHGGLIECDSQPGQTLFRVLIPFAPPATPHTGTLQHASP
ncbi:nitrogen regulation protein NR(II) [Castellaniella sp.]|uniref:nitrogen regulation protein NR(II) n=1 Tax=Castellaniella sp. TaxID=1955812 RepID=UPI003562B0C0